MCICKRLRGLSLSWPLGYYFFSCSTQLSMKFFMLINLKLLTIANSCLLNIAEHENFFANKYENANYCWHSYYLLAEKISCSAELSMIKFYNLRARKSVNRLTDQLILRSVDCQLKQINI